MISRGWLPELNVNGNTAKHQWRIADFGKDDPHKIMNLNTDVCLYWSKSEADRCLAGRDEWDVDVPRQWEGGDVMVQRKRECIVNEMPRDHTSKENDLLAHTAQGCCAWKKMHHHSSALFHFENAEGLMQHCGTV